MSPPPAAARVGVGRRSRVRSRVPVRLESEQRVELFGGAESSVKLRAEQLVVLPRGVEARPVPGLSVRVREQVAHQRGH